MVRILTSGGESPADVKKAAFNLACNILGADVNDRETAKRHDVKKAVGLLMQPQIRGRTFPAKKNNRISVNRGIQYFGQENPLRMTYPWKVKTNAQKKRYLGEQLRRKAITQDVFSDLMSVLD